MPDTEEDEGVSGDERLAVDALKRYAGSLEARAEKLVSAWKDVFAAEAVSIVAGTERVTSTVTDQRVERIRRLVELLDARGEGVPLPNPYELGVLLRVTVTQARTALRNWQARYPGEYDAHMSSRASQGRPDVGGTESKPTWVVEYDDPEVLGYAVDRLRRRGVQKGLAVDSSALTLSVPKATEGDDGGALTVLEIAEP